MWFVALSHHPHFPSLPSPVSFSGLFAGGEEDPFPPRFLSSFPRSVPFSIPQGSSTEKPASNDSFTNMESSAPHHPLSRRDSPRRHTQAWLPVLHGLLFAVFPPRSCRVVEPSSPTCHFFHQPLLYTCIHTLRIASGAGLTFPLSPIPKSKRYRTQCVLHGLHAKLPRLGQNTNDAVMLPSARMKSVTSLVAFPALH